MDVAVFPRFIHRLRRRIAGIIFALCLMWPSVHIAMVHGAKISTWRFFGWGMYATPDPETYSRLRIVFLDSDSLVDIPRIHAAITNDINHPIEDDACVTLFEQNTILHQLPRTNVCRDEAFIGHLDHVLHLGSINHLQTLVHAVKRHVHKEASSALVFITHQRVSLLRKQAYVESEAYHIADRDIRYLGTMLGGHSEGKLL